MRKFLHCIVDANILIDLSRGQLLPAFFALRLPTLTSEFILQEIHADERHQLLQLGLTVQHLDEGDFQTLLRSIQQTSVLSIGDWSALILAKRSGGPAYRRRTTASDRPAARSPGPWCPVDTGSA
jgi:hypothetical protein